MRAVAGMVLLLPLTLAASAPPLPQIQPLDQALRQAQAEQASAEAETQRLENAAAAARGQAEKLHAEQAAAVQAIEAAEARITAADAQFRLASAYVAAQRARLAREQQPVSSLLAGLAIMARRPPVLTIADGASTDDLVKVRVLLDSTLPLIRSRTRALSAQLAKAQQLEAAAQSAHTELDRSRQELVDRRSRFAQLERHAMEQSVAAGGAALSTGDVAIASAEDIERLKGEEASSQSAHKNAELLIAEGAAPSRPAAPSGPAPHPPFAYALPVDAPVVEGLGAVNASGIRSRGVSFATRRGEDLIVPADGTVRFVGPFRDYDGVVIIDHGGGWISLVVNVGSSLKQGVKVRLGDPLGHALGPVEVELSHNGQRFSPALIAGSSATLSKNLNRG